MLPSPYLIVTRHHVLMTVAHAATVVATRMTERLLPGVVATWVGHALKCRVATGPSEWRLVLIGRRPLTSEHWLGRELVFIPLFLFWVNKTNLAAMQVFLINRARVGGGCLKTPPPPSPKCDVTDYCHRAYVYGHLTCSHWRNMICNSVIHPNLSPNKGTAF